MTDVNTLFQWLNANPEFAGVVTFLISASESIAIIGTIIPGSLTMTAIGALAGAGVIPFWGTIIWAILGAIVGDGISYWLGYYFKDRVKRMWPFTNYPGLLESGEAFVHKYGAWSVFIGRFVGPVRALVPMVAGMLGMKPIPFIITNVASAIGWAPAYMSLGILLGAAALELPPDIAVHVMLILVLFSLLFLFCLWLIYKILKLFHAQTEEFQNWIWSKLKTSATFSPLTKLLQHKNPQTLHGQLNLAFYFLFTTFLFACLALYVKIKTPSALLINDAVYHLFRGIRTPLFDTIMLNITLLGQKEVILPVVLVMFVFLIGIKRWRTALHALALAFLSAGSVFVLKNILKSPRPWGILQSPETYSMPSGHTAIATTIFMGLAFLIARSLQPRWRKYIYAIGVLISFMVGLSRLYLGAHWFTDVLSAWLLSSAVLMLVILSYERRTEANINPLMVLLVALLSLTATFTTYHHYRFNQLTTQYTQINPPVEKITMKEWWKKNEKLAVYRVSLFGFPSQAINLVWAGDLNQIKDTLTKEGWEIPPARDLISTLHRIADVKSTEYLSMVSPQYLDHRPELILARRGAKGVKGLLVLRLWDANRVISETNTKIWVGVVALVPRSYSWLYKHHPGEITISPDDVFSNKTGISGWEWKIIKVNKNIARHEIMLIRSNQ